MRTGIDITEVKRFLDKIDNPNFLNRIFTAEEQALFEKITNQQTRVEKIAGRFCAKEAVSKALGTGISEGVNFVDIEILQQQNGRPFVNLKNKAKEIFNQLGLIEIDVSISHDNGMAISICVAI